MWYVLPLKQLGHGESNRISYEQCCCAGYALSLIKKAHIVMIAPWKDGGCEWT